MRHYRLAALVLGLLLALVAPGPAWAHPEIVRTEPAANAQLAAAPPEIRITFNEPLEGAFSQIQLFNAQGQQVDAGGSGLAPGDPGSLVLPLAPIGPGLYTVIWQTVGSDGHKVVGNYIFTVLPSAATPAAPAATEAIPAPTPAVQATPPSISTAAEAPGWLAALLAMLRATMLFGALGGLGGWLALVAVVLPSLPADGAPARAAATRRWYGSAWACLALLLLGMAGFALAQTLSLAGSVDTSSLQAMLTRTRLGLALLLRLGLALVLVALLANTVAPTRWRTALAVLLGAGILLSFSAAGHAAAQPAPLLPVLADWLHLVASSVWVGGLVVLAASLPATLGVLQTTERARALAALIVRFSTLALVSVAALTVSGAYAAWLHIAAPSDLWGSDYGRALLVKLALFGLMIALGAYNMWAVRPRFVAWAERAAAAALMRSWQQLFVWAVRGEVLAAALLIGAVGYLTNSAPPGSQAAPTTTPAPVAAAPTTALLATALPQPTRTPVPSRPFAETRQIDDVQLTLEITPASLGKNTFRVAIRDAQGQPVAVQKVELALAMAEMEMGETRLEVTPEGQGTFVVPDGWLSMVGEWNVHITVRRADADDITAEFVVPVGG